ncbi:MAG: hypothetical protein GY851_17580, partial [bacterium]|nr:hypothetical protein [bacterium]
MTVGVWHLTGCDLVEAPVVPLTSRAPRLSCAKKVILDELACNTALPLLRLAVPDGYVTRCERLESIEWSVVPADQVEGTITISQNRRLQSVTLVDDDCGTLDEFKLNVIIEDNPNLGLVDLSGVQRMPCKVRMNASTKERCVFRQPAMLVCLEIIPDNGSLASADPGCHARRWESTLRIEGSGLDAIAKGLWRYVEETLGSLQLNVFLDRCNTTADDAVRWNTFTRCGGVIRRLQTTGTTVGVLPQEISTHRPPDEFTLTPLFALPWCANSCGIEGPATCPAVLRFSPASRLCMRNVAGLEELTLAVPPPSPESAPSFNLELEACHSLTGVTVAFPAPPEGRSGERSDFFGGNCLTLVSPLPALTTVSIEAATSVHVVLRIMGGGSWPPLS